MPPTTPPTPASIEDLVTGNREVHNEELVNARALPPDDAETQKLREDDGRFEKLVELADVDEGWTLSRSDVVVRGPNAHFVVIDPDGVPTRGYFPLEALEAKSAAKRKRAASRGQTEDQRLDTRGGSVGHGTGDPHGGEDNADGTPPPEDSEGEGNPDDNGDGSSGEGLPDDIDALNATDTAKLIADPPTGVDPVAVWRHEQASQETPRVAVQRAAKKAELPGA